MKRLVAFVRQKWPAGKREEATPSGLASGWQRSMQALRDRLAGSDVLWLLLTWDVPGLEAVAVQSSKGGMQVLASASSRQGRFALALDEVMQQLNLSGIGRPRKVALAARHMLPMLAELPVQPDKPRRPAEMRELIQPELEPVLAEFGSLWSMGALLQARGFLLSSQREQVTMEEAIRRKNRASQLRYGEIAIELGMIGREALDECLDQQAALQNLDANIIAGWRGRIEDKKPLWLLCGIGQNTYEEWRSALARHSLPLTAAMPLSWLSSQRPLPDAATNSGRHQQPVSEIALELHAEEVVAVLRHRGQVLATRSEGRIERVPGADWLNRMVADWVAEARARIDIYFIDPADDPFGEELAENINLTTGHPCTIHPSADVRQTLWQNLLLEASAPVSQLPRLVPRELYGSPWKHPDVRRFMALGGVLLVLAGFEGVQRYKLYQVEQKMLARQQNEKENAKTAQLTVQVNQKLVDLGKDLDATRKLLEPLINDRTRLTRIVAMRADLPDLLYLLAAAVGSDAVMEEVHTDSTTAQGSAIQVVAWSPSYTSAQAFIERVTLPAHERGYGVAQTEILERKGRSNRPGHQVKFWLLQEDAELEGSPQPQATTAAISAGGGSISSRQAAGKQTP